MRRLASVVLTLLLLAGVASAQERIDLPSRPGVTEPIYLTPVPSPAATVILLPGGSGLVSQVRNNFLLRVAPRFAQQGIMVAVVDTPSDHPSGMGAQFRVTGEHATDLAAAVALAKSRSPAPVWLVGTSRGTISAALAAASS